MLGKTGNVILGTILYLLGILVVNVFSGPIDRSFFLGPELELVLVVIAILILSSLFYGNTSFLLLFFAGVFFGSGFSDHSVYALAALVPLHWALLAGSEMGGIAFLDLRGKANFFDYRNVYLQKVVGIIILCVLIGYFLSSITAMQLLESVASSAPYQFVKNLIETGYW
ncbi:MAG TPA: hypothetical protein VJG83_01375 [archaeon]|nr:hypothetical protein [archaeon]